MTSISFLPRRRVQVPAKFSRGFTLIELMVALTGGLFFTVFVFMLTRDVATFFEEQTRISETTLSTTSGFERLRSDIARAGYLSSPNMAKDVNRCPRPQSGAGVAPQQDANDFNNVPGLQEMAVVRILQGQTFAQHSGTNFMLTNNALADGGISPDRILLWGSYTTAEEFPVRAVEISSRTITLEPNSIALARLGLPTGNDAVDTALLQAIFLQGADGRMFRLVDDTQREQYGVVETLTVVAGLPELTYSTTVALIEKDGGAIFRTCGIRGHGAGLAINPVDIIRYQLDTPPAIANINIGAAPAYDATTRLDLVRQVLDPAVDPTVTDGSDVWATELVAEYAVDLRFGLTVVSNIANGTLTYIDENAVGPPSIEDFAGETYGASGAVNEGPHLIRGVHARLMVRNRLAERSVGVIANPATTTAQQMVRAQVATNEWARTRTLRSHIAVRNTKNSLWN